MAGLAAKLGDKVIGTDTHIVMVPSSGGSVPTPRSLPFNGTITGGCVATVLIDGKAAAVVGSMATNQPPHVPSGGYFQNQPTNQGTVIMGSATVLIGGKPAARTGDKVMTCNDPAPAPTSAVVVPSGTVTVGG